MNERRVLVIARNEDESEEQALGIEGERVVFDDVPIDDLLERIFAADVVLVD